MPGRLTALVTAGLIALSGAAAGCGTDDAAEKDARDAGEQIDKEAGGTDEKLKDAGSDAVDAVDDDDDK